MVEPSNMLDLKLDDGSVIPVQKDIAIKSSLINSALDDSPDETEIDIKEVSKDTLLLVIEYLTFIKDNEEIKIESPLTKPLDEILGK